MLEQFITFEIDTDTVVKLDTSQLRAAFLANIPAWAKDSREPCPNMMFDVMREGVKAMLRPQMNNIMQMAYGPGVDKIERRADILPYIVGVLADYILVYAVKFSPFLLVAERDVSEQERRVYTVRSIIANTTDSGQPQAITNS